MTNAYTNCDEDLNHIFDYLLVGNYFTEEELILVTKGFGDNVDTYNTICQVRYGMDFDQIEESEEN